MRTIERDVGALQQAGVPIYADVGRRGGYTLDKSMTLPPLNFTPAEAVAVSVALRGVGGSPFDRAARSALRKIVAAMPARETRIASELAERVRFIAPAQAQPDAAPVPWILSEALVARRVLRMSYRDKLGAASEREVEPVMFLASDLGWYLLGWCRLRQGMRAFRIDRIVSVVDTGLPVPPGAHEQFTPVIPDSVLHAVGLG